MRKEKKIKRWNKQKGHEREEIIKNINLSNIYNKTFNKNVSGYVCVWEWVKYARVGGNKGAIKRAWWVRA